MIGDTFGLVGRQRVDERRHSDFPGVLHIDSDQSQRAQGGCSADPVGEGSPNPQQDGNRGSGDDEGRSEVRFQCHQSCEPQYQQKKRAIVSMVILVQVLPAEELGGE